ncbi:ArdC family protein [Allosediminivita pacifica]|uniref:Antirestriction protein ArdC n=1 Tax=Allosediminivita pacifica TaxID=1267769 RepID=A0A2T6ADN1_9RHOB|nr:zincin-like metallopeptidase domain-containing protein [Allosediminivita pacifica]PTX41886.1 antirestriction protein ArdC [Allosediminivita pacifica]GGB25268.1 antirestriction protein [Allosediminivita pacifica]
MAKAKFDVYQHVTNEIIAQIEAGTRPWRKPWTGGGGGAHMPLRFNAEEYRGINVLMLWATASAKGYTSARWMTYRQAQELGGQVSKGEKSATVVKYGTIEKENEDGDEQRIPYCRAYRVFNADQIEGLADEFYIRPEPQRDLGTEADPELEAFFARSGAIIETSDQPRAFYDLRRDVIQMPPIATFHAAQGYYGTLAHELTHWTGADKRLERFKRFNDRKAYAFEELVAEIGACMLGVQIGVEPEFDQSAAYVEGWLQAMKDDKRAIFRAASEAQKAVDYITEKASREAPVAQAAA